MQGKRAVQHKKILLVDDEKVIVEELCELLLCSDFSTDVATSVDEALDMIEKDLSITLVITDMRMPGKSGADLIRALQSNTKRVFEYLIISGHLDAGEELDGLKMESVTLMRKPIDVGELLTYLDNLSFKQ